MKKDITKIALNTGIFKGQTQWLFSYLKTEKLAHVLLLLQERCPYKSSFFEAVAHRAVLLPALAIEVAVGRVHEKIFIAEVLSLLVQLRLLITRAEIEEETSAIIMGEYERIMERISTAGRKMTPLISMEQLSVHDLEEVPIALPSHFSALSLPIKDINKGHTKGQKFRVEDSGEVYSDAGDRAIKILDIIKQNKGISIKGISAIVRDCSEKTIQRELGILIEKGLVIREGERRWSIYRVPSTSS